MTKITAAERVFLSRAEAVTEKKRKFLKIECPWVLHQGHSIVGFWCLVLSFSQALKLNLCYV